MGIFWIIEREGWRDKVRLLLQVHDELVYEVKKEEVNNIATRLKNVMETMVEAKLLNTVPIIAEVSVGPNWGEVRKVKM